MSLPADGPAPHGWLAAIPAYTPGARHAAEGVRAIRLAANENPLGPSPAAIEAIRRVAAEQHRYPPGDPAPLRRALGDLHGIDPDRIVCGVGSDEILGLAARAFAGPGDEVLHTVHGFAIYRIAARAVGATPVAVPERDLTADIDALLAHVTPRTRILYLANPNNPTGTLLPPAELARLVESLPRRVLLVLDGAYAEYVLEPGYDPGFGVAEAHPHVLAVRTFSKVHGLGGTRIGFGYGSRPIIEALQRLRDPFNLSVPGLAAATASVADRGHVARSVAHNIQWRAWLAGQLGQLGLTVTPSHANFLLVRLPEGRAAAARAFLATRGILVRPTASYGLPDHLRVTVGLGEELEPFVDGLRAFLDGAEA